MTVMSVGTNQKYLVIYRTLLYSVLVLAAIALIAEILPEIEAKIIVIPTLLLIITIGIIDLVKLHNVNINRM